MSSTNRAALIVKCFAAQSERPTKIQNRCSLENSARRFARLAYIRVTGCGASIAPSSPADGAGCAISPAAVPWIVCPMIVSPCKIRSVFPTLQV
jgi:hypothetical protein